MKAFRFYIVVCGFAAHSFAQLSTNQKLTDFQYLADLYAKQYAPYEWKRDTTGFDLLNISKWLERVRATKNDLDFYEICIDYVAALNDAHDNFSLQSDFAAKLNFTVDIYDGKVLIDSIDRSLLPAKVYPFEIGDELVSVDGKTSEELIQAFLKYSIAANPRSTRRNAASRIVTRRQSRMPHAIDLGDSAEVVIRRQSEEQETYTIPWVKTGIPLTNAGPVPVPKAGAARLAAGKTPAASDYMLQLQDLQLCLIPDRETVLGQGSLTPLFRLPTGFVQRLGRARTDFFYSGTFEAGGYKLGFIKIPDYIPASLTAAIGQFEREIAFFEANTDGLIIDEMRNPGGFVSYVNELLTRIIPFRFRSLGFEVRATSRWVRAISAALEEARAQGEPQYVLDLLGAILKDVRTANQENRGRTGPLPLDDVTLEREPAQDRMGRNIAFTKPLMVLVDEFSASGGDAFPATIQDNQRGLIFGFRTMGAGGTVADLAAGSYSEGLTRMTQSLMSRKEPIVTPDYPTAPYVENIGVRPDIEADYMTRENLLTSGRPFVNAFVAAMTDHIRASR